jgi:hypothetical protein
MSRLPSKPAGTTRLLALLAWASVSVSACGGTGKNPASGDPEGTGGGGGEPGAAGGGGGTGGGGAGGATGEADAGIYDAPPVPASLPLEMAPALVAGVVCAKAFACCEPNEGLRALTMSQPVCDQFLAATLAGLMGQANAAIAQGRAAYDPEALAACLRMYTDRSCADARVSGGLSAYRMCNFVRPLTAAGAACSSHIECVEGFCEGTPAAAQGVCTARKANGQPCQQADECVGRRCAAGTCGDQQVEGLCGLPTAP